MVSSNKNGEGGVNAPGWMNEDFFKRMLDKMESESVKITSMLISHGSVKNDNFGSVVFRAKLKYTLDSQSTPEKSCSLIIKTEPFVEGMQKEKLNEIPLFESEVHIYEEVLPKIEAELRAIGDETVLCPKLFHYSLKSPQCMVLEDLVAEGYATINNRYCSLEEMKMALKKLAKLHAVGFKLGQKGDHIVNTCHNHYINVVDESKPSVLRDGIRLTKEMVGESPDLQEYVPHIEAAERFLIPNALKQLRAYKNGRRSRLEVLNHGDFHLKNVMVKNVDNKLKEMMLLDYQNCVFGSLAIDLHYTFTMFYSPEMRCEQMDELLYYYITNFQETLRRLKYPGHIPTITEVRAELQEYRNWALYLIFTMLIFNYAFTDNSMGLADMVGSEAVRRSFFAKAKIVDELRVLLPRFLHWGYFEE